MSSDYVMSDFVVRSDLPKSSNFCRDERCRRQEIKARLWIIAAVSNKLGAVTNSIGGSNMPNIPESINGVLIEFAPTCVC